MDITQGTSSWVPSLAYIAAAAVPWRRIRLVGDDGAPLPRKKYCFDQVLCNPTRPVYVTVDGAQCSIAALNVMSGYDHDWRRYYAAFDLFAAADAPGVEATQATQWRAFARQLRGCRTEKHSMCSICCGLSGSHLCMYPRTRIERECSSFFFLRV